MTVRVAPAAFGGAVAVPSAAVDRLKLASGDALKVLLFVCRHMDRPLTAEELADGTGLSPAAVADGAAYWEALGVLTTGEGSSVPFPAPAAETPAPAPAPAAPKAPEKAVVVEKPNLPSYDMICKRVAESDEVRVLFSEAQGKLGRTIGTADQSRLLMLLDYYGLPVEVILTVCEYARAHKQTTAQIYSMGIDWAKREIDTLEAADEELKRLESVNTLWFAFAERTGIRLPKLSAAQRKYFATWKTDWRFSDEMITLAFDEMKKNTEAVSLSCPAGSRRATTPPKRSPGTSGNAPPSWTARPPNSARPTAKRPRPRPAAPRSRMILPRRCAAWTPRCRR